MADFDSIYPWAGMKDVTIDGQAMKWIPRFYFKRGTAPSGSAQAGKPCIWVSDRKRDGYKIHPAFMYKGEVKDGFYIGCYEASTDASSSSKAASVKGKSPLVSIDFPTMQTRCTARNTGTTGDGAGWHLNNIYEVSAVNMLLLIELGTPDVQTKIGSGNVNSNAAVTGGSSNAVYRGLHEWWGNVWEMVDGFKGDGSGKALMFDNTGKETYKATGITPANGSQWQYPIEMYDTVGDDYDLSACFIPSKVGAASAGTYADGIYGPVASSFVLYKGGDWRDASSAGAFAWLVSPTASYSRADIGGRLAKYDV